MQTAWDGAPGLAVLIGQPWALHSLSSLNIRAVVSTYWIVVGVDMMLRIVISILYSLMLMFTLL